MADYQNPHDKFFKEIFSRLDLAEDFFRHYLPPAIAEKIKPDSLERLNDTFIDENLKLHLADLLFRVELLNTPRSIFTCCLNIKTRPTNLLLFRFCAIWSGFGKRA
jgi:hypothetical protein